MVHLETLEAMRAEFKNNLKEYITKHPGEFVLFERGIEKICASFYKTTRALNKAVKKYEGTFGPTILVEKIPCKTHRFNKNNKTLEFLDYYAGVCPNDRKTKLVLRSGITRMSGSDGNRYKEQVYCPDCGYQAFRKPSSKAIEEWEREVRRPRFK